MVERTGTETADWSGHPSGGVSITLLYIRQDRPVHLQLVDSGICTSSAGRQRMRPFIKPLPLPHTWHRLAYLRSDHYSLTLAL
jgi:hypothetical protein